MTENVSCLCLTYGRPHLLEEAVESFLRQTWEGEKELVVVNDHPRQTLVFHHPQVVIFNLARRLRTLGEKRNLAVALARYDNLLVWDDDDIYLPWRIKETMATLGKHHFYKCPNAWVMNDGTIDREPGYNLFHGGSAYTRWLFEQSGGYPLSNGGEDADIEYKFQNVGETKGQYWPHTTLPKPRLYYIYRWGHGSYHATGHASLDDINPEVAEGVIELAPQWRLPYEQLAREAAEPPRVAQTGPRPMATSAINFIAFSKNRPLQLDGYIRSYAEAGRAGVDLSVLYDCDDEYREPYDELIRRHPWVHFALETDFHRDLLSLFTDAPFTCFGCDDCVFTGVVDWAAVTQTMLRPNQFAFSLRLGRNICRSIFNGPVSHPAFVEDGEVLTWDLNESHSHGDFGYAWELNGTVYPSAIAKAVVEDLKPASPNVLEADGGGRWSSKTRASQISCFRHSVLAVPTVNVVQGDFPNPIAAGQVIGTTFMLDAWRCGMRLDIGRYRGLQNDCIHVPEMHLTNT